MEIESIAPVAARVFGALVGLPIGDGLQLLPRLCLSVLCGVVIAPGVPHLYASSLLMLPADFGIGYMLAVPSRCMGEVAAMFGEILDTGRGQTLAAIVDPLNGQQVSDLTTVTRLGVIALVISLGGIEAALTAVRISFEGPPTSGLLLESQALMGILQTSIALAGSALHLASIWLLAFLLVDIGCACMAKVAHGLSFSNTAAVAKLIAACFLLLEVTRYGDRFAARIGRLVWQAPGIASAPAAAGGRR